MRDLEPANLRKTGRRSHSPSPRLERLMIFGMRNTCASTAEEDCRCWISVDRLLVQASVAIQPIR